MRRKTQKMAALAGMIGPIFYFCLISVLGLLWSDYNPISTGMSEIGAVDAPFRNIMNYLGFSLLGISIVVFSFGLLPTFGASYQMYVGFLILLIGGIVMFIIGFLPCDSQCIDVTMTGKLHSIASTFVAIAIPVSAMVSAYPISKKWGKFWGYVSFYLGAASLMAGPIMFIKALYEFSGLIQRIGIGFSLLWVVIVAWRIFKEK